MAPDQGRAAAVPWLLLGVGTGTVLGLLTAPSPVVAIAAIGVVLVVTVINVVRRGDASRTLLFAGTLIGAGIFLLLVTASTTTSCLGTDDFCGNANVWPLGALAVITAGVGALATVVVALRRPN